MIETFPKRNAINAKSVFYRGLKTDEGSPNFIGMCRIFGRVLIVP